MRARFWIAFAALALALAILAPALQPLSGSMDAFASDLANGTFRPFGDLSGGKTPSLGYSGSLGGFTGSSAGNYLPGSAEVPKEWSLDRDGRGGDVVIDSVFDPDIGAMKRLKAYDAVSADGTTLLSTDTLLRPITRDSTLPYDLLITGSFPVQFHAGSAVAIYSPDAKAIVDHYGTDPPLQGGVKFFKDREDTFYALASETKLATLNVTYRLSRAYFSLPPSSGARVADYRYTDTVPRPNVPAQLQQDAQVVLARAGVKDAGDVSGAVDALARYFRSFTEGDIPPPSEVDSLYLALALGEHGCCRHRAFAFLVTAEAIGIPTRVVVNEAHAFVEVAFPDGHWHQINLGGCGAYTIRNPNHYPELFPQATAPRSEANPDEGKPVPKVPTFTNVTDAPPRILKGETYLVNGTVLTGDGRPVAGARVDVFLNVTKNAPGRQTGAGATGADGTFSVVARVPADAPAQGYQLVARGADGHANGAARYDESWSDPPVDVFSPTRFAFGPLAGAVGFPANVTGRLVDVDGTGVANATLRWTAAGAQQPDLRTDASGKFLGTVRFDAPGTPTLSFSFAGSAHHGPADGTAILNVTRGAILLPADVPVLVRGESSILSGRIAIQGANVAGTRVTAAIPPVVAGGNASADGSFSLAVDLPGSVALGSTTTRISAASLNLLSPAFLVRIAARPNLTLAAPDEVGVRDAWVVEATLQSDNGTALPGDIVELRVDSNATPRSLLTNRTGVARFEFPAGALPAGSHAFSASFPGDADHVAATIARPVTIAEPWYALVAWWVWAAAAGAVALCVALVLVFLPGSPVRKRVGAWAAGAARPERAFLALAFPDHPLGVPPHFEPGDVARVRVVARDREGTARDAKLGVNGTIARADGERGALVEIRMPPHEGSVLLRAHATGLARLWTRPVERTVPVGAYRAAVERGFVALRERAALPASATPHDVVLKFAPALGAEARRELARAAAMFEVADYSEAPVDRAYYHSFATSLARVMEETIDGSA